MAPSAGAQLGEQGVAYYFSSSVVRVALVTESSNAVHGRTQSGALASASAIRSRCGSAKADRSARPPDGGS